ncbi:tocopherol cyclase family protein [Corynebacterium sp.]|uniref:tocopherol cyclase family protein n=1 Tax=Corynebacterium sp. TaxID=1720 RepID=UPI0026DF514E|nr:tocopherol cyclase family protein [Corynebacterium sp.]MDO5513531.1 tocopherol cyclase family protein [Corynebacterium sp.]
MTPITRYRATGADLPFGQPTRAHRGVSMEGYFWRLTDPATGRVLIALCGANEGPQGAWSTIGLAGSNGFVRTDARDGSWTDPHRLGVRGGAHHSPSFSGDEEHLRVDLGPDARLDIRFHDLKPWPHRAFGGSSVFQMIPGLNQYWHPWLLGGRASGTAILGDETWEFTDAQVYGEKNWGREGFPESWWWGQAQGFADTDACVAFAGGLVTAGPMKVEVTGLVVKLPDARVLRLGNPVISPVTTRTTDDTWHVSGRGYGWEVEINASAPLADAFVLPVPLPSEHRNVPGDLEHLTGDLEITVSRFGRHVWSGRTSLAALEHGGLDRAADELRRRGLDPTQTDAPPVG